jgi:hypothetical protein
MLRITAAKAVFWKIPSPGAAWGNHLRSSASAAKQGGTTDVLWIEAAALAGRCAIAGAATVPQTAPFLPKVEQSPPGEPLEQGRAELGDL